MTEYAAWLVTDPACVPVGLAEVVITNGLAPVDVWTLDQPARLAEEIDGDDALHGHGWHRTSPWTPYQTGFMANVELSF